ncbi:MAG: exo-1,3-beta-glucanase [Bogoriella megaspora]|nr:MAG: exo-1,3-beta-glucanase [Bogoriella megaspora]
MHGLSAHNATNGTDADFLWGVNIGGWLILESWMNKDMFEGTSAVDQWTFDSRTDRDPLPLLRNHWKTWFTEEDVINIKKWGFNALRIPIGYWAFNTLGAPYKKDQQQHHLDEAIRWSRTHGLKVWVVHHGVPGSQNGFDNSGHKGSVHWLDENYQSSINILSQMASKYGSGNFSDVVVGLELANEPISWKLDDGTGNEFDQIKKWTRDAYAAVRKASTNHKLRIIMHDAFKGPSEWTDVGGNINEGTNVKKAPFGIDTHLYQNQESSDSELSNEQHIQKACQYSKTSLLPQSPSQNLPVYVGEFSFANNICVWPSGKTAGQNSCNGEPGCQCANEVDPGQYAPYTRDAVRKWNEAQYLTYHKHAQGTFVWAYKGPGEWGLKNAMAAGTLPNPISDLSKYKYPNICG